MYHRILPHEFFEAGMFGNGEALEEGRVGWTGTLFPRRRNLKEVADHAQIEGFAKASGPGYQVHLAGMIDEVGYKMGLVDEVTSLGDEFSEIGDALFQPLGHGRNDSMDGRKRQVLKSKWRSMLRFEDAFLLGSNFPFPSFTIPGYYALANKKEENTHEKNGIHHSYGSGGRYPMRPEQDGPGHPATWAYQNDFLPLSRPVSEARQMAEALESIGFEVIRAYNVAESG